MASSKRRRRRRGAWRLAAVGMAAWLGAALPVLAASPARLARLIAQAGFGSRASVTVLNRDGSVLLDSLGRHGRVPASNEKLLTSVAALELLGPGYRFSTRVAAVNAPVAGVISGDLYLVGGADWTLASQDPVGPDGVTPVVTLDGLASALYRVGVRRVDGAVVADATYFDRRRGGKGWKPGFLGAESPPLSALSVDRNTEQGRTQWRPELAAAQLFTHALARNGIGVTAPARVGKAPPGAVVIVSGSSPPLGRLLTAMDKESDNFAAEMLLKQVGAVGAGTGSSRAGAGVARRILASLGVPVAGLRLVDGSGLSALDRAQTSIIARLLDAARRAPIGPVLYAALPIAGVDGTLQYRMQSGPALGVVHAKTGTLAIASALSGYTRAYVFSVIINAPSLSQKRARALEDAIAQALSA